MSDIKLTIDETEYTLNEWDYSQLERDGDCVYYNDKWYKAIPKQPSNDWEIVSFKNKATGNIDNIDSKRSLLNINWWLDNGGWEIHEVRRISDGKVFKVGDETNWGKVKGFRIVGETNKMVVEYTAIGDWQFLSSVEKVKPKLPLFTTEDGLELFDRNHEVFAIKKGHYDLFEQRNVKTLGVWLNGWYTTNLLQNPNEYDSRIIPLIKEHYFVFSTKEAADNWITYNKPYLSLNDLLSVWGDMFPSYYKDAPLFKNFEKLAKSKINP